MSTARILVIDDDPAVLTALPEMFRLWMPGTIVDLCASARLALDRIDAVDYDTIVSDIRMPDMDGLALLEHIKTVRPQTPTILITGYGDEAMAAHAIRGGAYDYLLKPVDRDYLLGAVKRAIQFRQVSRQAEQHKHTEVALREREQSLQTIMDTMPCLLIVTDADGRLRQFNREAERVSGYDRDDVLGKRVVDVLVPSPWADLVEARLAKPPDRPAIHRDPWRTKSGEDRMIEWHCTPMAWMPTHEPCLVSVGFEVSGPEGAHQHLTRHAPSAADGGTADLRRCQTALQEKISALETLQDVAVGRELRLIALERQVADLQRKLNAVIVEQGKP